MKKIIIVGGVAGGMSAATRLRRLMETAEIIVFEKGPYVSFANCGLPYYISGEIAQRDQLLVQTPERLKERFNLDVRPYHEVVEIHPESNEVVVEHNGEQTVHSYDHLILSPGAKPFIPPIPGLKEATNVFTLRNIPDVDGIMAQLSDKKVRQAVVLGAGFIGIEAAENLAQRGLEVTLVEKAPHILPPLDEEMAKYIELELEQKGVRVLIGQAAARFEEEGKTIILDNEERLTSDLTILSVGVQPDTTLAQQAGIQTGLRGGILVDEHYRTNYPNIYAVGDAIVVNQHSTKDEALIALASPANRQGRQVADNIAGITRQNKGSLGTAILRAFDLTVASTGLNERTVRQMGFETGVVHVNAKDHAGYFPGATDILLKLIFNPKSGEIYGAQAVGAKGVDKRIDVIATAIKGGMTLFDLPELELSYAPPFGSAKDPVNLAGYAAMNIAEGLSDAIQWHELEDYLNNGYQILDVRNPGELARGRFKNAVEIPLDGLRERLEELDPQTKYIVSCHSGLRSYIAERILKQHGFTAVNLDGAFSLYHTMRKDELIDG